MAEEERDDGHFFLQGGIRSMARSGSARCGCCVGTSEAIRCAADAMLPGQHADQSCGDPHQLFTELVRYVELNYLRHLLACCLLLILRSLRSVASCNGPKVD